MQNIETIKQKKQYAINANPMRVLFGLLSFLVFLPHAIAAPIQETLQQQLSSTIDQYPENVRGTLREIVLKKGFDGVISKQQAQQIGSNLATNEQNTALALIKLARVYAKPPISHYQVGAVAIGSSGNLYFGCNLEFPGQALSFSVHAEQSATMNAWMHGETGLQALAISAAPCGYCRQFLNELSTAASLNILLKDTPPIAFHTLLPKPFGPVDLGMTGALMQTETQPLILSNPKKEIAVTVALAAAATSYAPYSTNYAGLVLESRHGQIAAGRYAENAAYSPSMSPLQAALSQYNLAGLDFADIKRAVLVQTNLDTANQADVSKAALWAIAPHAQLEVWQARSKNSAAPQMKPRKFTMQQDQFCGVKH